MTTRANIVRLLLAALMACAPWAAEACGVCFGEPNNPQTNGMNAAIGFLLIVVMGAGAAMVHLIRVASAAHPPDDAEPPLFPPQGR